MTTISPQFSARAHFSPRFGEHGAQANPTPQKAPAPHVESVPEEDGFVRVEKDSAHSSAQHTPLSSPPPEKEETASSTGEKPEAEKHELSPKEQKRALKKQNMVPLVTIWTHADNVKDAKTKAEGPQHIVLKKAKIYCPKASMKGCMPTKAGRCMYFASTVLPTKQANKAAVIYFN